MDAHAQTVVAVVSLFIDHHAQARRVRVESDTAACTPRQGHYKVSLTPSLAFRPDEAVTRSTTLLASLSAQTRQLQGRASLSVQTRQLPGQPHSWPRFLSRQGSYKVKSRVRRRLGSYKSQHHSHPRFPPRQGSYKVSLTPSFSFRRLSAKEEGRIYILN